MEIPEPGSGQHTENFDLDPDQLEHSQALAFIRQADQYVASLAEVPDDPDARAARLSEAYAFLHGSGMGDAILHNAENAQGMSAVIAAIDRFEAQLGDSVFGDSFFVSNDETRQTYQTIFKDNDPAFMRVLSRLSETKLPQSMQVLPRIEAIAKPVCGEAVT